MHTEFWSENIKGRDHSEDLGISRRIMLEFILEKQGGKLTGFMQPNLRFTGRLLLTRSWTFGFH